MLPAFEATTGKLLEYDQQYNRLTDLLGILRQESKNETGTIISVFGILINSNTFVASLFLEKISKTIAVTKEALARKSLTLKET